MSTPDELLKSRLFLDLERFIKRSGDQEILALLRGESDLKRVWITFTNAANTIHQVRHTAAPMDVRRMELLAVCKIARVL